MALDLKDINQNKNATTVVKENPAAVPVQNSTGAQKPTMPAADPGPTPSQFELRPPRFWLVLGIIIIAVFVGILILALKMGAGKSSPDQVQNKNNAISTPVSTEKPTPPPPISNQDDKKALSDYFGKVSTNFKPEYMDKIPQVAANAYKNYQAATGDNKLDAARTFYIYLNSPGVAGTDPIYAEFTRDVQSDLEKTVGKKLF
jgi:hypothetical protein